MQLLVENDGEGLVAHLPLWQLLLRAKLLFLEHIISSCLSHLSSVVITAPSEIMWQWQFGMAVSINEVTLHRVRLALGWVDKRPW